MKISNSKSIAFNILLLIIGFLFKESKSADLYLDGLYEFHLVGEIQKGDAERLALLMADSNFLLSQNIKINSSGGDLDETMKIVSLVKGEHLGVVVDDGKVCASSCFFILLSGSKRSAGGIGVVGEDGLLMSQKNRDRFYGAVGIHRPYFKNPDGNPESQQRQIELMRRVKTYLAREGVSQYLIDEMMSRSSNNIYWLKERDLEALGDYPPDIEETLIARCGYKTFQQRRDEEWSTEKINSLDDCVDTTIRGAFDPLKIKFRTKLRTGWRPWKDKGWGPLKE